MADKPNKPSIRLYLVDGSSYIFRAYHALPPLTRKSDGLPVGAVSGYCNMLYKLLADMNDGHDPTHLAVIFDFSAKTFRNDLYPEYKANRPEPPEDLVPQFPLVREATRAFNVPCIETEGYEADDIIAAYARLVERAGGEVVIVSSDKDLMQLVSDRVTLFDTMKNRRIGRVEVIEKFGVPPEKVVDVQALAGDSSDNVPGVPGIGVKTAAQLIQEYGDLETLLARAGEIKQNKRRESLIEHADKARISKQLVTLRDDAPLEFSLDDIRMPKIEPDKLIAFLDEMEFAALKRRVLADFGAGAKDGAGDAPAPAAPAETAYETVFDEQALARWIDEARERGIVAFDTETDSLDAMRARLVGFSLATAPGRACYVPLGHGGEGLALDDADIEKQMPLEAALEVLKPLLEDPSVLKVGQNVKYDALVMARHGIAVAPFDDTMLISYALDSGRGGHGMDELAKRHLGLDTIKFAQVAGSGKKQKTFNEVAIAKATEYAAEDADMTLRLFHVLKPRLADEKKCVVYETLERPLVPVVMEMERAGVKVDPDSLSRLSADFAQRMAAYEAEAMELAGEEFNIGSPKQISEILFGKLGLPGGRKTAGGAWSTKADVLEELAAAGHPLPRAILNWRGLSKLKSTYTDALPQAINPETGRIHTSYSLAATTTGRLASTDPNLQNIPIRTDDGRKIREAFIAEKGNVLISADYSQIELRLLAHIADIKAMKQAFEDGLDIHAMTASEMFGMPIKGMDPMVRRRAKAINFGIIYGISAYGLANQLGIARGEAKEYIERYFRKFPGIRRYMDETIRRARAEGHVETVFGRRIHVGAINDKNQAMRNYAERQAINAPIQGSAADVIRRAMIRMPAALARAKLQARMLLQVHDELIFEAPKGEAAETRRLVAAVMEKAPSPAVALSVPLVVDTGEGRSWSEAH
ncbi:DNA polymerase I [Amphiplicatus metriothermophilus]|uniref:DNA polymerase I n=1 Tax=Amphiplicatus metriothermophilus TaxID=1519374 RepID=A0A239PK39_9PROT|nr:DNA polymerase I [Amphiplicatus metriothermophilus]MBB5517487.1 DNA polymerase-1 [Amphiplicatus metriothermophilus]SNT68178.1 DNA polymerase I [Amphiplicatus metriothermophilus]